MLDDQVYGDTIASTFRDNNIRMQYPKFGEQREEKLNLRWRDVFLISRFHKTIVLVQDVVDLSLFKL